MQHIGLSGSRFLSSPSIMPAVTAFLQGAGPGFSFNIGCCPTGLDHAALSAARAHRIPHTFYKATNYTAQALRLRTIQLVASSQAVFSFPFSVSLPSSGSWLAVSQAAGAGIPVFIAFLAIATPPLSALPVWRNITGWQVAQALPFPCPGITFFQPITGSIQTSLF